MSHLDEAQRQLIVKLRAAFPEFEGRVDLSTDVDFSDDGAQIARVVKTPIMYLVGPAMAREPWHTTNAKPSKREGAVIAPGVPGQFVTYTAEDALDLTYDVVILADKMRDLTNLTTKVHGWFMNGKWIDVLRDPENTDSPKNRYELELVGKFAAGKLVNRSNLKDTMGKILVRGVLVSDGEVFERGGVAETVNLNLLNKLEEGV